jgi:hypothetical protein
MLTASEKSNGRNTSLHRRGEYDLQKMHPEKNPYNVSGRNTSNDYAVSFLEVLPGGCSPSSPPEYGNWTVNEDRECHQIEFTVNGSLIIESNITLTLYDTNLTILNGSLESGGNLSMLNSEVITEWS